MAWRHMSIARAVAPCIAKARAARAKTSPPPVQVPASACCLHEGHERSVGAGWGGAGSQTRVGDGAGQPRSGRDVTARQALCGLTKPGQEVCAIPAWRDQRVRRVEVEPPSTKACSKVMHAGNAASGSAEATTVSSAGTAAARGLPRAYQACAAVRTLSLAACNSSRTGLSAARPCLTGPEHAGRPCGEVGPRQAEQNSECPGIVPTGLEELRLSSALLSCMTGKVCLCKSVRAAHLLCRSGPH
jgi:hypothetical protein